jgi:phosphatidylinositol alpha-1,6-mannosyltransferase
MNRSGSGRTNVLFVGRAAWSSHGGIQRFNRRVADSLRLLDVRVATLMVADAMNAERPEIRGFNGSMICFAVDFLRRIRGANILLLGHINFLPFGLLYRLLNPSGRVILFAHGVEVWNDERYRKMKTYEPWLLDRTVDCVAIVSRYSRDLMVKEFRLAAGRFTIFPNAVDITTVRNCKKMRDPANVLVVSRLGAGEAEKHVDKVIRAFPSVLNTHPNAVLSIVGSGEMESPLRELALQLNIADSVVFLGSVDDATLDEAYCSASVFALPSSKEGFGIVYLEAWMRGVPVIASCFGAGGEVVSDGKDGFTVDPQDLDALADRLVRLISDRELANKFAGAGLQKIRDKYSGTAFVERLNAIVRPNHENPLTRATKE